MNKEFEMQNVFPCPICIVDNNLDYSILYANELFYSLVGYTAEDVLYKYKNHMSIFWGVSVSKQIRQAIKSNETTFEMECSIKNSFHKEKWIRLQADFSNIKTNNTVTIILIDISQHKLREDKLNDYQKKSLDIFDLAHFDAYEYDCHTFQLRCVYARHLFKEAPPLGSSFPEFYFDNQIIHSDFKEKCTLVAENLKSGKSTKEQCDIQVLCENGKYKWVRCFFEIRKTDNDISLIHLFFDITSQKEATLKYLHETMYYQAMLSDQDAYGHVDITDDVILKVGGLWNGYNEIISKIHFSELFDEFKMKVVHPDDREQYSEVMSVRNLLTSYANGIVHLGFEFRRIVEKNKMAWVGLSIHLFKNPIDNHIMALMYIKNVQSHKKSEYNLLSKSIEFDVLTNLYNRESAEKLIVEYLKDMKVSEVCTLVLIDVDDFMKLNNHYGHEITNHLLVKISELLIQIFRKSDIIARYSQDQFIMLLKNYDCNVNLKLRLDHFMKLISKLNNPPISVSMGVAIVDSGSSYDRCFRHADIALFAAKHSGKACYVFYHDQILNEEAKLLLEQSRKGFSPQSEMNLTSKNSEHRDTEMIEEFNMLSGEEGDIGYLINPETYELVCGNQVFYNRIGKTPDECRGKKCYELMHHRSLPCPFCRKSNWSEERFYLYKNYNDILNKDFLIKNKLVQWKNQQMVLAYAIDLSDDRSIAGLIENDVLESNYILNGIHVMQSAKNLDESIYNGLDTIGHFFRADNVRMWYMGDEGLHFACDHSWTANDTNNKLYQMDEHDIGSIDFWLKEKKWEDVMVIESLEAMLCYSYDLYQIMNKSKITNQRWIELIHNKKHKAFIEINNVQANYQNTTFMESFKSFMIEEWNKRDVVDGVIYANYHDSLTKLYNRNQYDSLMEKYDADDYHSIAAVCININGLSRINKASGDNTGDYFIVKTAQCLQTVFEDNEVFRLNGDEFIVAIFDEGIDTVQKKITYFKKMIDDYDKFSVSVGFAWDDIERHLNETINTAVQVMRNNKRQYYQVNQSTLDNNYQTAQNQLINSIDRKEFEVWLQPKFDSYKNQVFGAEALIRYRHPKYGILPPAHYIPSLEENHLIRYIDLYVFEEVCKLIQKWNDEERWVPIISLNFSRVTMMEENLIDNINLIFNKYNISKEQIEIEVVESYADIGKTVLEESLRRLKYAGYKISLDDFGTSFTNLALLSSVEVDVLKIDKSLIHSLSNQEKNRIILKNVIEMCNGLGIKVIAEGVETIAQRDILIELGCHLFQGYLYDKPIEVKEFVKKYLNNEHS